MTHLHHILYSTIYLILSNKANTAPLDELTVNFDIEDHKEEEVIGSKKTGLSTSDYESSDCELRKSLNDTELKNLNNCNEFEKLNNEKKLNNADYKSAGGCIRENNVAYWGEAIKTMITRDGEQQCANWCGRTKICKFWVFQKSNNLCLLKTHNYDRRNNVLYSSGSKECATDITSDMSRLPTMGIGVHSAASTALFHLESGGDNCERCTENVENLSSDKIEMLSEAMRKVHASPYWERITSLHGEPVRPECDNVYCCIHSDDGGFLPWHRTFINSMNKALQKYETNTIMPYWDWTTVEFPKLAYFDQVKNLHTGQYMENPFFRGFEPFRQIFSTRNVNTTSTTKNLRDVLAALELDDFVLFSTQFNFIHAGIHRYVGGSMRALGVAAYDPIFYLHHAFVDLVWTVYQILKPNSRPSHSVLQQRLLPFGMTVGQTLTLTRKWYNLDMNSTRIIFGGMTLAQIQNRITRRNQESGAHDDDRIYAGFFLRSFKTSGIIKFNICNLDDCSYPGGEVSIFGGKHEKSYINSNPAKVDVTENVINAGIKKIRNLKFMVTSFEDFEGNSSQFEVYQPIRIARMSPGGEYAYCIDLNKAYINPPEIRIPKYMSFEIESPYEAIHGTENENNYLNCDPKGTVSFSSRKPINLTVEHYYYFDDDCRPHNPNHLHHENYVSKINIVRQ